MVQHSLGQFLEAFEQTLRRATLFGSQRCHEEVDVVEQGHMIIGMRLCYLEQLVATVLHRNT